MNITFETKALRRAFTSTRVAENAYGREVAAALQGILADFIAARCVRDFSAIRPITINHEAFCVSVAENVDLHGIPIYGSLGTESDAKDFDINQINALKIREIKIND